MAEYLQAAESKGAPKPLEVSDKGRDREKLPFSFVTHNCIIVCYDTVRSSPSLSRDQADSNIRTVCGTFPGVKFAMDELPDPPQSTAPRTAFTRALEATAPNSTFLQSYAGLVFLFLHRPIANQTSPIQAFMSFSKS